MIFELGNIYRVLAKGLTKFLDIFPVMFEKKVYTLCAKIMQWTPHKCSHPQYESTHKFNWPWSREKKRWMWAKNVHRITVWKTGSFFCHCSPKSGWKIHRTIDKSSCETLFHPSDNSAFSAIPKTTNTKWRGGLITWKSLHNINWMHLLKLKGQRALIKPHELFILSTGSLCQNHLSGKRGWETDQGRFYWEKSNSKNYENSWNNEIIE